MKKLAVILTPPLILSAAAVFGPSAAQAYPSDCQYEVNGKALSEAAAKGMETSVFASTAITGPIRLPHGPKPAIRQSQHAASSTTEG